MSGTVGNLCGGGGTFTLVITITITNINYYYYCYYLLLLLLVSCSSIILTLTFVLNGQSYALKVSRHRMSLSPLRGHLLFIQFYVNELEFIFLVVQINCLCFPNNVEALQRHYYL